MADAFFTDFSKVQIPGGLPAYPVTDEGVPDTTTVMGAAVKAYMDDVNAVAVEAYKRGGDLTVAWPYATWANHNGKPLAAEG